MMPQQTCYKPYQMYNGWLIVQTFGFCTVVKWFQEAIVNPARSQLQNGNIAITKSNIKVGVTNASVTIGKKQLDILIIPNFLFVTVVKWAILDNIKPHIIYNSNSWYDCVKAKGGRAIMVSPYSRFLSESGKKREENFIHEGGYISLYLHPLTRPWGVSALGTRVSYGISSMVDQNQFFMQLKISILKGNYCVLKR